MTGAAHGFALWFTGLPGSGKTTLALSLRAALQARGVDTVLLDSDDVRARLIPHSTYQPAERDWFYHALAALAALLTEQGVNVLIAATGQQHAYRDAARASIAAFAEVYVACPPEVCRARDPKGLWARADRGDLPTFPGVTAPYDAPTDAEVTVHTDRLSVADATTTVLAQLDALGFVTNP